MSVHPMSRAATVGAFLLAVTMGVRTTQAQDGDGFQNLQVLPADITVDELNEIMLGNLRGLGLRRLAGEGCLYCHVGDMEEPRTEWDFASDAKVTKRKARVMMAMVREINARHLPQLETRIDSSLRVSCSTCHAGRTDPRPLPDLLLAAYEAGGTDSLETRYRALHERYYGGDAYDFRVGVLAGLATELANRRRFDDAVAVAALNIDVYPMVDSAKRTWLQLRLERTVNEVGVEAALDELDQAEESVPDGVLTPGVLDGLGWRLYRQDRQDDAIAILRHNLELFADEYVPNESIAFVLFDTGEPDAAFEILERWLQRHPDHDRARRLLINLRG